MLYACDHPWWRFYFNAVAVGFDGELWTISEGARDEFGLHWIYGTDQSGLSRAADYIHTGKNSGYQAVSLAYLFGGTRVTLLGFDMSEERGRKHWHGDHPRGLANGAEGRYKAWRECMSTLAADLAGTPCKVLNASRRTALKCYQRITLENALHEETTVPGTG